jgi:hypothetical protein
MPSTVIYKQGFPTSALPVETSATVGSDGAITGSATFVVAATAPYEVGNPISASLFSSLRGVGIQGLFVDSVSLEKRGGLVLAKVNVIGAVNPPVIHRAVEIATRSYSVAVSTTSAGQTATQTADFDYQAENITLSSVVADGESVGFEDETPNLVSIFNNRGSINVTNSLRNSAGLAISRRVITNETRTKQNGIVRVQKSFELILQ